MAIGGLQNACEEGPAKREEPRMPARRGLQSGRSPECLRGGARKAGGARNACEEGP